MENPHSRSLSLDLVRLDLRPAGYAGKAVWLWLDPPESMFEGGRIERPPLAGRPIDKIRHEIRRRM